MNKKLMLLAAGALTALAFAALPAVASAGTPQTHCNSGAATCEFTSTGKESRLSLTSGLTVICQSNSGSGTMTTTGGSIKLVFHECKESIFGTSCTTEGQTTGTITTTLLGYDNVYVTDDKTMPGVLVTPNSSHFSTFTCVLGGKQEVKGNGVIGELTAPACGKSSTTYTLNFEAATHGNQQYKQNTATGTSYGLTTNGTQSAMKAEGTVNVTGGATLTCV